MSYVWNPNPKTIPGYVVQCMYGVSDERLVPFDHTDEDWDLRFRGFIINGFSTRRELADEILQKHFDAGWQARVLPGIAEAAPGGDYILFTVQ